MNLNQITIAITDLDKSIAFYRNLGMQLIVHSPGNGYARFECPGGDATFSVHVSDAAAPSVSPGASLCFEVDDVDAKVKSLKAAGVPFDTEPVDQRYLWREAWTRDPDGYRIAIYHAGVNRKNPPWRVTD